MLSWLRRVVRDSTCSFLLRQSTTRKANLVKIVGEMIDITDRKRVEDKLMQTLEELTRLNEELKNF